MAETQQSKRLRLACDFCHEVKVRCSGGNPCTKCHRSRVDCNYSFVSKMGKPKGSRNKKTISRLEAAAAFPEMTINRIPSYHSHTIPRQLSDQGSRIPNQGTSFYQSDDLTLLHRPESVDSGLSNIPAFSLEGLSSMLMSPVTWDMSDPNNNNHQSIAHINGIDASYTTRPDEGRECGAANTWLESEWKQYFSENALRSFTPEFSLKPGDCMRNTSTLASISSSASSEQESKGVLEDLEQVRLSCSCLKQLTDCLCHLISVEQQPALMSIDIALREASTTLGCTESVLCCSRCKADCKVLLLIITVLQMAFNWIKVEHDRQEKGKLDLPGAIQTHFGNWKLSHADSELILDVLTSRVLATSDSVVDTLRARIDYMAMSPVPSPQRPYPCTDIEALRLSLGRLETAVREMGQAVRPSP